MLEEYELGLLFIIFSFYISSDLYRLNIGLIKNKYNTNDYNFINLSFPLQKLLFIEQNRV